MFEDQTTLKNIQMKAFIAPGVPQMINCDPKRMKQVFVNLLGNAIKFTKEGHIYFRVSCADISAAAS